MSREKDKFDEMVAHIRAATVGLEPDVFLVKPMTVKAPCTVHISFVPRKRFPKKLVITTPIKRPSRSKK